MCLQIKRAFRTLRTRAHPDKGGDADEFHRLVTAYNVLSDEDKVRSKSIALGSAAQRDTRAAQRRALVHDLDGLPVTCETLQPASLPCRGPTMMPQGRFAKVQGRSLWRVLQEVGPRPGCSAPGVAVLHARTCVGTTLGYAVWEGEAPPTSSWGSTCHMQCFA